MGAPVSVDACKGRAGRRSGRVQALGTAGTREAWCPGSGSQASEGPCQQGMAPGGASACSAASQVRHDTAGEAKGQAPALQGGQEVHRQPAPPTAPHHPPSHPSRRPTGQRRSGLAGGTYLHQRVVQRQQAVPQAQRGARRLGHAVPLVQLLWRGGGGEGCARAERFEWDSGLLPCPEDGSAAAAGRDAGGWSITRAGRWLGSKWPGSR